MQIVLPNDWDPRPYQEPLMRYLDNGGKRAVVVWHRRSGKDLTMLHQVAKMAHQRRGVYWHIFPTFAQARKALWEGFTKDGKRILENVFPGFLDPKRKGSIIKRKDDQQMSIELKCGSIWRLIGSDKIELVGAGPVGVVFSEFAMANPKASKLIQPMLRESGGWTVFVSTPRGKNHLWDQYKAAKDDPSWFCEVKTLAETEAWKGWERADGTKYESWEAVLNDERRDGMPEALVQQEYNCDWTAALVGSIWGDLIDAAEKAGGLRPFGHPFDNVFTSWDVGFTDSTAIWFWQVADGGVDLIDYYENSGQPLSHYYDLVEQKPYKYIKHWLPHDTRQTTLAAGVSILNQTLRRWPGQVAIGPQLPIVDGIQAGRWLIQQGVRFHPKCGEGVELLRQYHYEYDEEKKTFGTRPEHDFSSHASDAFRYLACVVKKSELLAGPKTPKAPPPSAAKPLTYSFTLEQLHEDRVLSLSGRRRIE